MKKIIYYIKLLFFIRRWKRNNAHNKTYPGMLFNEKDLSVGNHSYGQLNVRFFGDSHSRLIIKNYCSIADETIFLVDGGHNLSTISTYPFKQDVIEIESESLTRGDIIVDDDVWIGYRSTILSGVHIGQGAVIAAGSVVVKDVPPYAIVGGVPAKVIKYRFDSKMIDELLKIDYNKLTKEEISKHIDELYVELKDKSQLGWLPKIY